MVRKTSSRAKLPAEVTFVSNIFARDPSYELAAIGAKLCAETPNLARMWQTICRLNTDNDDGGTSGVFRFLRLAARASSLPRYNYLPAASRRELAKNISGLAKTLSRKLVANDLDASIIYSDGTNFNGFFFYEEFSEPNQALIDADRTHKLAVSKVLDLIAARSKHYILGEVPPGKAGKNVRAIRFARSMATSNRALYGRTLNAVIATAANAIFGTVYVSKDIRMLLTRQPLARKSVRPINLN